MHIKVQILIVAIFIGFSLNVASAQSYSTIDGSLGIYCADLPDATNAVVRINGKNGQYDIVPVDPEAEKAAIIKLRKSIQQRINALQSIKKDYDPSSDTQKLKQVFKYVLGEVADGVNADESLGSTQPHQIFKKIGTMIALLKNRLDELDFAIETIDRCVNNEDLIPPPVPLSPEVIIFEFIHPDYGTLEVMRGVGATGIIHKKRIQGSLCVSAEKPSLQLATPPEETEIILTRNPCIFFFQSTFTNFPFCHYGANPHMGVAWFGKTNFGFSSSPVDEDEKLSLENKLASYGKITVRAPTKKKPCRK